MKALFTKWYAAIVKKELYQGKDVSTIKPDIRTSTVKPIHARWLIKVHSKLGKNSDLIVSGFEKLELKISFGLNFTRLSNVYIKYCTCIQCGSFAKFYGRKYVVKDEIAKLKGDKINGIYSMRVVRALSLAESTY